MTIVDAIDPINAIDAIDAIAAIDHCRRQHIFEWYSPK